MPTQSVTFTGFDGNELAARLEVPPDGRPRGWALFAHCFTCSKDLKAAVRLTRELSRRGMGVMRFDFTGLGESEGDFAETNFSSNVDDLLEAARWLDREREAPRLLVGHSLGGAAVIHAARRLDSVRAVATLGAPAEPSHVLRHVAESREEIEARGEATVSIAGRSFRVRRHFLQDLEASSMDAAVSGLGAALLIMHAPTDAVVGIENAAHLYERARHPKSFISLDDADHLLTRPADAEYAARVLAEWASRYIGTPEPETDADALAAGDRVVARTEKDGIRTDVRVRSHALVVDEPVSVGGDDAGPTPYDLVVAGLGSCTSMTLRMYADRKGWPLDEVRVRLKHTKHHRDDERECQDGGDARLDHVVREIELCGPLDEDQRSRLMEIADRCPVHRTLDAGVRIETKSRER